MENKLSRSRMWMLRLKEADPKEYFSRKRRYEKNYRKHRRYKDKNAAYMREYRAKNKLNK